jgi:alkanesulfonate monooxygenase SsuD/methylene tetrahydromethanopterin reductase-like flavin-dependent oxidoreductase (luciferase family)
MVTVAGEAADGWILHPLHTPEFVRDVSMPAFERGLATAGRRRTDCEISAQIIAMIGHDDEAVAKAREGGRAQLAFYASTPTYRVVLDHHGWGDLQPVLNRLAKEGRWLEMVSHISDEMLDRIGVSGTPVEVGSRLKERCSFADRVAMIVYDETGDEEALSALTAAAKAG